MLIVYNCVRLFMEEASSAHDKDPLLISFLDTLQYIIEAIPHIWTLDKINSANHMFHIE